VDTRLLKATFNAVADQADELVRFFYADLFARGGPEVIEMFPPAMAHQRDRLLGALVEIVTNVDDLDKLALYLSALGRDHRKFDVRPEHYDLVGHALLTTLAHFAGDTWTKEAADTWAGAYALIAKVMQAGAAADTGSPPWWDAVVIDRERPTADIAVIRARLQQPMPYLPGQSMAVQSTELARYWRFYSPANAPRDNQLIELHIKIIDGGMVSTALALHAHTGDLLRLGPPVGSLQLDTSSQRDVLMLAGSTGVAPLMAILEQLASQATPPDVRLFFGARDPEGLYALPALEKLAAQCAWLTVTPAVSAAPEKTPEFTGEYGNVVDVAARSGDWHERDAYICGSSAMVQAAATRLCALGMPGSQLHVEDFGWEG
jgi:NAD(P)H-flavin reductase/hemoglobin-like flavoprotein